MRPVLLFSLLLQACSSSVVVLEARERADGGTQPSDAEVPDATTLPTTDGGIAYPLTGLSFGAAFDHTCAAASGAAFCWGLNVNGQLGQGDTAARLTAARVPIEGYVLATCAGETHSCALTADNRLYCWGENNAGQLGVGDLEQRLAPTTVEGTSFTRIACGGLNTCGIRNDGALYCWGENFEGKIGQDDPFTGVEFVAEPTPVLPEVSFRKLTVGQGHVCAIDSKGALYCWGRNNNRQLGLGVDSAQVRVPTRVGAATYVDVTAGQSHTCAVRSDHTLECWGNDSEGSLGLGPDVVGSVVPSPTRVSGDQDYRKVSANWFHTCALRADDSLWCWGRNQEGQLGLGDNMPRNVPTRVGTSTFRELTAGHFHSCALRSDGLFCWGENSEYGQLGLGEVGRRNTPTRVPIP